VTTDVAGPILGVARSAHDIIEMLPDDVHAEVIEGEVIVNAATPAGCHARTGSSPTPLMRLGGRDSPAGRDRPR
jgi:hypothetical protein